VLSGESILCFAPDPWDDIWRNRHQIMSLLSEQNQVLYVEPRHYLRTVIGRLRRGEISLAELRAPRLVQVNPRLQVFHQPLYAPLSGRAPLRTLTETLRVSAVRGAMRRLQMRRPILWLFRPEMADVPGHYGERLLIYHIVDEYSGYADVATTQVQEIREREMGLIARADLVLVTSHALFESKRGINPNTHWVPNGVDYPRFAAARAAGADPVEMVGLPHPRIGYVGAINDKLDIALLLQVAEAYSRATLILVGPVRMTSPEQQYGIQALQARPNVHFFGQVTVERVADFMAACDVGLLPYRYNAWTQAIQPLKLYEYLACGLPVVASDIPAVRDEADVVRIAADAYGFVQAVGEVLAADRASLKAERQARAAQNTWRQRVERISELVTATLPH
jgi:glycosyltransferase involved in cell wall biosynthesis